MKAPRLLGKGEKAISYLRETRKGNIRSVNMGQTWDHMVYCTPRFKG